MSDRRSSSCIFRSSVGKATTFCGLKGNSRCQYFVRFFFVAVSLSCEGRAARLAQVACQARFRVLRAHSRQRPVQPASG